MKVVRLLFLFHFSPKYCKYTITTIINSIDSLLFHPFPTLKSQGTKRGNDKCEQVGKGGLRDVVMCAPWMDYGRFWSADLGLLCYYVRNASEGREYDVA